MGLRLQHPHRYCASGPRMLLDRGPEPHRLASESGLQTTQTVSLCISNTKSDISQKLKVVQKNSGIQKSVSEHCASSKTTFIFTIFGR